MKETIYISLRCLVCKDTQNGHGETKEQAIAMALRRHRYYYRKCEEPPESMQARQSPPVFNALSS